MNDQNSIIASKVEPLYRDYGARAREIAAQGRKVIGYVCSFVPLELITAAGCVPFRIRGDVAEPITKGDTLLEAIVCPFYRSCFDLAVKDKYDFLSGVVIPHACDSMTRSFSVWSYSLNYPYFHFVNIPSVVDDSSFVFFNAELGAYKASLEEFTGQKISDAAIANAIKLHNENRRKAKAIYAYRQSDPPMISGVELTKVMTVGTSLPIEESNALFDEVLAELKQRTAAPVKKGPRILFDAACVDNIELIKLIEESGANVVTDTICNGTRDYFPLAEEQGDPIDALSRRYLDGINCPKTYRTNTAGTFEGDCASRFGDIAALAKDYKVDGVVLYIYKYCDPFGFEVPARKAFYDALKVPVLYLEDMYSTGTIGQLSTRVQAFLEMIG